MKSIDGSWQNNPPELPDIPPIALFVVVDVKEARPSTAALWLDLVDKATRSWPATLRLSVLSLAVATGTALIAAAVGVTGQLALAAIGLRVGLRRNRQGDDPPHLVEPDA
jgi:hypothetical protein